MSKLEKYLLKDIAVTQTGPFGSQLHEEDYVDDGTPIVTVEHLGEIGFLLNNLPMVSDKDKARLSKYILKEGDIVFSRVGSIDRCTYVSKKEDGWMFSGRCLRVRFNDKADARFVSYYFRQKYFKEMMMNISVGATMPSLNTSLMDNIELYLPSKREQQKIAALLSALDSKIELNNRINTELEAMAKTLYDYWFVQFDFPDQDGKPYKSSGGKMVWKEELKREVPDGWEVAELRNYLTSNRGVSYNGTDIIDKGIPMINLNSFNSNSTYKQEGIKSFSGAYSASKVLKPFDLVMCNTQQTALDPQKDIIGKSFLVPDIFETEVVSSHHVTTINVKTDILKYYLNSLFNTEYFHRYISGYATGTNILGLNFEGILCYQTAIPNHELLSKYKSIIVNIEKQKGRIITENQTLSALRDWLLPMLMNGQVKVTSEAVEYLRMAAEPTVAYKKEK